MMLVFCAGLFSDMDRTFLSEHAALGLEHQHLQVTFALNDVPIEFVVGQ
jgi:hypothetical protein